MTKEVSTTALITFLDKELEKDLGSRDDIERLSINIPHVNAKYLRFLHDEAIKYNELKSEWDKLYREKYNYYRYDYTIVFSNKAECDIFINGDDEIIELKRKLDNSKIIMNHLEGIIKMIGQLSFNIRNSIELKKMKNGIV